MLSILLLFSFFSAFCYIGISMGLFKSFSTVSKGKWKLAFYHLSFKKQILLPYSDKTGQTNMHIHDCTMYIWYLTQENKHVHKRKADYVCKKLALADICLKMHLINNRWLIEKGFSKGFSINFDNRLWILPNFETLVNWIGLSLFITLKCLTVINLIKSNIIN